MTAISVELSDGIKATRYKCQECDFQAKDIEMLMHHTKSDHEGGRLDCDLCDFKTMDKNLLALHTRAEHKGRSYNCGFCEYKAKERYTLQCHIRSKHSEQKSYRCHECKYEIKLL